MIPPLVVGLVAAVALVVFDSRWSGTVGLVGALTSAPGLLIVGAPFGDPALYPLAILASIPIWLLVGLAAARRATRRPVADWSDYWREYAWIGGGIAAGSIGALLVATGLIGESIL